MLLFTGVVSASNLTNKQRLSSDTLKNGKNYLLFSKTKDIQTVVFSKKKKSAKEEVKIHFGLPQIIPPTNNVFNSTIIVEKKYKAEDAEAFVFDKIKILKGKYTDVVITKETFTRNLFTLTGIEFPLRLQLISREQVVDLELTEVGDWEITIELKNN